MHRVTGRQSVRTARPWLWTALAVAVVGAAAVWVVRPDPAACHSEPAADSPVLTRTVIAPSPAAPDPVPPLERLDPPVPGEARYYAFGPGVACSIPDLPLDGFYVGVPTSEYAGSSVCGAVVELGGPLGTVRAHIVDRCPGCAPGQYDLSTAAFARIADQHDGVAHIRLRRISNPVPIPEVLYRVKDGSSAHWLGLLFADTGNPVSRVEIRPDAGGAGRALTRGPDNYWSVSGAGPGPFTASVTDTEGHRVDIPGITVSPGAVRRTGVGMYRFPELAPAPAATATAPVTTPPPASCS
ncbi:expansin EXLX1 family cellulose-binding protein [Nocardia sp. BMG51109]|uniref:expansin EXLX1 family cellulose-binding protein n=1 Tax=Nocardia sp. BMG51109 TaxID=1056816 RepID=UPI000463BF78|nr:expansin EXLX1 family cellulose-binding protein [Nocardia sp. BMG51109]